MQPHLNPIQQQLARRQKIRLSNTARRPPLKRSHQSSHLFVAAEQDELVRSQPATPPVASLSPTLSALQQNAFNVSVDSETRTSIQQALQRLRNSDPDDLVDGVNKFSEYEFHVKELGIPAGNHFFQFKDEPEHYPATPKAAKKSGDWKYDLKWLNSQPSTPNAAPIVSDLETTIPELNLARTHSSSRSHSPSVENKREDEKELASTVKNTDVVVPTEKSQLRIPDGILNAFVEGNKNAQKRFSTWYKKNGFLPNEAKALKDRQLAEYRTKAKDAPQITQVSTGNTNTSSVEPEEIIPKTNNASATSSKIDFQPLVADLFSQEPGKSEEAEQKLLKAFTESTGSLNEARKVVATAKELYRIKTIAPTANIQVLTGSSSRTLLPIPQSSLDQTFQPTPENPWLDIRNSKAGRLDTQIREAIANGEPTEELIKDYLSIINNMGSIQRHKLQHPTASVVANTPNQTLYPITREAIPYTSERPYSPIHSPRPSSPFLKDNEPTKKTSAPPVPKKEKRKQEDIPEDRQEAFSLYQALRMELNSALNGEELNEGRTKEKIQDELRPLHREFKDVQL